MNPNPRFAAKAEPKATSTEAPTQSFSVISFANVFSMEPAKIFVFSDVGLVFLFPKNNFVRNCQGL